MRITVDIDDKLYQQALKLAGPDVAPEKLVQEVFQTFVRVQAAKCLAALGGATPEMKTTPVDYEQDVNAWANDQARLLRVRRVDLLDIEHIADEIECVGKREQHELARGMATLFTQFLKWAHQPENRGVGWEKTIRAQRKELRYVLAESPSLATKLQNLIWLDMVWSRAVAQAVTETGRDGFPVRCPWDIQSEVLCDAWLPAAE